MWAITFLLLPSPFHSWFCVSVIHHFRFSAIILVVDSPFFWCCGCGTMVVVFVVGGCGRSSRALAQILQQFYISSVLILLLLRDENDVRLSSFLELFRSFHIIILKLVIFQRSRMNWMTRLTTSTGDRRKESRHTITMNENVISVAKYLSRFRCETIPKNKKEYNSKNGTQPNDNIKLENVSLLHSICCTNRM